MVNICILAPKAMARSTEMIIKEAKKMFLNVDFVPIKEVVLGVDGKFEVNYKGKSLIRYDYVLPRIDSKRASFGYHVIKALDMFKVRKPYSAEAILVAHNKWASLFELSKFNIPVPKTLYTSAKKSAGSVIDDLSFPLVMKLVSSYGGKGVLFLEGETAAKSVVKTLDVLKQDLMLEEFVPNPGEDIRGFVVGDEVVASMKRIAKKGEKRANVTSGGTAKDCLLTDEETEICLKSASSLQSKILAIDMIRSNDGPKVIEVNINPGLVGITSATGVNIANKIARFCHNETKR